MSLGLLADRFYGDALMLHIRYCAGVRADVAASVASALFLLLISAIAVFCFRPILPLVVLFTGLLFGAGMAAVIDAFGSAGVTLMPFLLFRCISCMPVFMFLWLEQSARCNRLLWQIMLSATIVAAIAVFDALYVSPLLCEIVIF